MPPRAIEPEDEAASAPPPSAPWVPEPRAEPEIMRIAPPAADELRAQERLALPPAPRRGGYVLVVVAWVASLVLLGSLGWSAYVRREAVMVAWPPSIRGYQLFGLASPAQQERTETP